MRRLLFIVVVLSFVLALSAATATSAQRAWTITDLGFGDGSTAVAINKRGQIVGYRSVYYPGGEGRTVSVLWQDGVTTDVMGLPSVPVDINDRGEVVGTFRYAEFGEAHGFLWRNGVVAEIGDPAFGLGLFGGLAGINGRGQVVGHTESLPGRPGFQAFLWQDGRFTYLGDLGGGYSIAEAINDRGDVVGRSATAQNEMHSFLWRDGVMTDIGGAVRAVDINDHGQVVGDGYSAAGNLHAFLWNRGAVVDLSPTAIWSLAGAVNQRGQVAGTIGYASDQHAAVWQDGTMTDLGTLPRPGYSTSFSSASDINDRGQVVGWSDTAAGYRHAVLFSRK